MVELILMEQSEDVHGEKAASSAREPAARRLFLPPLPRLAHFVIVCTCVHRFLVCLVRH